jgi:hypothetical protein
MPICTTARLSYATFSYSLRCDAKQAEQRFIDFTKVIHRVESFELGDYFSEPFIKGSQPKYIESPDAVGVFVINTLAIQKLSINLEDCRVISEEDFEKLDDGKKLRKKDVLLTMDGGTSIGKPALFDLDGDFTIDSHVAVLRPKDIDSRVIVYLLASPFGQLQFQQAESGASGQTSVTEDDVRRFRFPKVQKEVLIQLVKTLDSTRIKLAQSWQELEQMEKQAWEEFNFSMLELAPKV